jgi:hypothetical protein
MTSHSFPTRRSSDLLAKTNLLEKSLFKFLQSYQEHYPKLKVFAGC